jgi:hypothetical protein
MLRFQTPRLAVAPGFALPDGNCGFQGIDAETCRFECRRSVRGWRHNNDRGLAHRYDANAMQQNNATQAGPVGSHLRRDVGEAGHDMGLVGLVFKLLDALSTGRMIAGSAAEEHHRAAARKDSPVRRGPDRK